MLEQHKVDRATVSHKPSLTNVDTFDDPSSYVVIGLHDDDPPDSKANLERFTFAYIYVKVTYMVAHQVKFTSSGTDLEDIADEVYIHFWEILEDKEREPVRYPDAYLAKMIHHKLCDEIRKCVRYGNPQPFSMFEGETFLEDKALFSSGAGMSDPALEHERKQSLAHFLHRIAYAVSKLPARQKLAMTCELLEIADNLAWMTDALTIYGVDTQVQWPADKKAKQRLQANLSAAKLAMARCLHVDIAALPTKRHVRSRDR